MTYRWRMAVPGLLGLFVFAHVATAQDVPNLEGTWSAEQPGQDGMVETTIGLGSDHTYAIETALPNGSRMRIWGLYQASEISPNIIQLSLQRVDWKPHAICTQAPGFQPRCVAFDPPPPQPQRLIFESPDRYQVDGIVWSRDPEAALLQQPVADPLVQYAQAPVAPRIPQPSIPSQTTTSLPSDPRSQYETGNQNFLYGYMKGCSFIDGRWQDCQQ